MRKNFFRITFLLVGLVAFESRALAQTETEGSAAPEEAAVESSPPVSGDVSQTPNADDHIRNLTSLDVRTRIEAAMALRELRDPRAIPALTQTVRTDPSPEARGWAVRALWQTDQQRARAIVIGVAQTDADERVRNLARQLVPEATPPPAPVAQSTDSDISLAEQWAPLRIQQRVESRRSGKPLRVAGWITFGISYGMAFCLFGPINLAVEEEYGWPLFIPVIGPIIAASFAFDCGWEEDIMFGSLMIINAAIQTAGFAMAIVGHVKGRRHRSGRERSVSVRPTGPGLSVVGRF